MVIFLVVVSVIFEMVMVVVIMATVLTIILLLSVGVVVIEMCTESAVPCPQPEYHCMFSPV